MNTRNLGRIKNLTKYMEDEVKNYEVTEEQMKIIKKILRQERTEINEISIRGNEYDIIMDHIYDDGSIVITGPESSGKTTTLITILENIMMPMGDIDVVVIPGKYYDNIPLTSFDDEYDGSKVIIDMSYNEFLKYRNNRTLHTETLYLVKEDIDSLEDAYMLLNTIFLNIPVVFCLENNLIDWKESFLAYFPEELHKTIIEKFETMNILNIEAHTNILKIDKKTIKKKK